jgi:hypothetical protein
MTNKRKNFSICLALAAGLAVGAGAAHAQATYSDKAVKQLEGTWITVDGSRTLVFAIKDNTPRFDDTVGPGVKMSGGYGPGTRGAGYILEYPRDLKCSYNISFPSDARGNEMIMTLIRAEPRQDGHRCIVGTLKRTH